MESSPSTEYPRLCIEVGLTCEACTGETARQLAQSCRGLRGKMIGQLFVQIHPHPACSPMHARFAEAYQAASAVREGEQQSMFPELEPISRDQAIPRRPPARERRKSVAAAASSSAQFVA